MREGTLGLAVGWSDAAGAADCAGMRTGRPHPGPPTCGPAVRTSAAPPPFSAILRNLAHTPREGQGHSVLDCPHWSACTLILSVNSVQTQCSHDCRSAEEFRMSDVVARPTDMRNASALRQAPRRFLNEIGQNLIPIPQTP